MDESAIEGVQASIKNRPLAGTKNDSPNRRIEDSRAVHYGATRGVSERRTPLP